MRAYVSKDPAYGGEKAKDTQLATEGRFYDVLRNSRMHRVGRVEIDRVNHEVEHVDEIGEPVTAVGMIRIGEKRNSRCDFYPSSSSSTHVRKTSISWVHGVSTAERSDT